MTGGAKGIGEETVKLFTKHGAKVMIADVDNALGQALANALAPSVTYIYCDVTSEQDIKNLINSTISSHGHLDMLFNNAGLLGSRTDSIVNFDANELDRLSNVNMKGMDLGMKHVAHVMIPRNRGCIISTASVSRIMGGLGSHAYTATKHATVGLTKNVACDLGRYGIRVNCISPSGVATTMLLNAWKSGAAAGDNIEVEKMEMFVNKMGNLKGPTLKTKDVVVATFYLANDESKYVSGHNLVLDGGINTSRNFVSL